MTNMTKAEIKAKWLHELRNGGHKQIQGTLKGIKSDGTIGYCCLGVLEEKVLGNQITAVKLLDPDDIELGSGYEGPTSTYDRLRKDIIGDWSLTDDFMEKNDNDSTFAQIADYIEDTWNTDSNEIV